MASCGERHAAQIDYPIDYSLKVMGENREGLAEELLNHLEPLIPDCRERAVRTVESKNGKYISVTIYFRAQSRDHVLKVFSEAKACRGVVMVL
jgi:putative lipoic acid-binding regulatory protein